ncbi:hypothetical protein, partial [Bacillus cereus]|uniref:hypothetical protein n=1 Tax=Bacillus cereus TaxID=1396 RepID=UPI001C5590AE
ICPFQIPFHAKQSADRHISNPARVLVDNRHNRDDRQYLKGIDVFFILLDFEYLTFFQHHLSTSNLCNISPMIYV